MGIEAVLNSEVTMVGRAPPGFLSFPGEIRNKVYRLLFRYETTMNFKPYPDVELSTEFLYTCRQIYTEALPILYGENTWRFKTSNTEPTWFYNLACPFALCHDFDPEQLDFDPEQQDFDPEQQDKPNTKTRTSVLRYLRRFSICIEYTSKYNVTPIRKVTRWLEHRLRRVPRIDFLQLECNPDCTDNNYSSPRDADSKRELINVLKTWLCRLRNVKTVVIGGLPELDTNTMKERLQSSEPREKTPLPRMYAFDEKHVQDTGCRKVGYCKENLREALLAVEEDDIKRFKAFRTVILREMRQYGEEVNKEVMFWDPEEDEDEDLK